MDFILNEIHQWVILITAILGLIGTIVALAVNLVKSFGSLKGVKEQLKGKITLQEVMIKIISWVKTAEVLCNEKENSGENKLNFVLSEIKKFLTDNGVEFDKEYWSNHIKEIIDMTKTVNTQAKDVISQIKNLNDE